MMLYMAENPTDSRSQMPAPFPLCSMSGSLSTRKGSTVLLAISAEEYSLFLSEASWEATPHLHFDPDTSRELWRETLERENPEILISCWSTPPLPLDWLEDSECALKYVHHIVGSVRRVVPRSFIERGGLVSNWGTLAAPPVAEHALLLALSALRNQGKWKNAASHAYGRRASEYLHTRSLFDRSIGIHGFGNIARTLVGLLKPFSPKIRAYSAGVPVRMFHALDVERCDSLEELCLGTDVFFECEALTAQTKRSVSEAILRLLPDNAVFVNVGRGDVVDEAALIAEAESGRLRLALDVLSKLPADLAARLNRIPDAILTPHIAGPTMDDFRKCGEKALFNAKCWLKGGMPEELVTMEIYDRST